MSEARFIWRGKDCTTYGALGSALCELETEQDAREFWDAYIAHLSRPAAELAGNTADHVARSNIGYLMGYYSEDARRRVYDLFAAFDVSHPIFGRETPTVDQALEAGRRFAMGEFS